ncbi:TolC family protein [Salegentibacter sp. F188]|uniref:TolC family protein n=1 Tax=Autumnicola patrickiae TaxID=3075591 RepID=A0ABU3E153_9FLAO|nr:TolC family protein [Salegentibacter sp. F188]MDT0689414.1 TolC family protein [Salegentibacter sp. F188]
MKLYIKIFFKSLRLPLRGLGGFLFFFFWGLGGYAQNLDNYLQVAAENNPEVQSAYTAFEAAMQQVPQVSSLPDPTLTMSAFGRMVETRLGAQEARFSLMQMFPWFGTLEAKATTAELMAKAKFQEYLDVRGNLSYQVKSAYAEIFQLSATIAVKEDNLEILDSYRELALRKFEAGSAPMVNVVKIDIQREQAITEILLLKEELETLRTQFNLLLNRRINEEVFVADTLMVEELFNEMKPEIINEQNFEDHPAIEQFNRQAEAYESQQVVARKNGLPQIGIGVDYSVISERTDANPVNNGQDAIMPMLSVSLPIFRKKYKAAQKEAELMETATEQNREAKINNMKSELEMTQYKLRKAQRLISLYDRQLESSKQANKLQISAFSNATGNFEEVLQMNQDILMLQLQKIEAIKNAFVANAKLDYFFINKNQD